jgi:transcriptional regulator with XRE-family HTH domain
MHLNAMIDSIHSRKQGRRPHYIAEWAEKRNLRQVDIAAELGADKGLVSRWFDGATPSRDYQLKLSALFNADNDDTNPDPALIFRHPDDDWLRRFLQNRSAEEVRRIKAMLEAAFGTDAA